MKIIYCLLFIASTAFTNNVFTPTWAELQRVKFTSRYNDEIKGNMNFPVFPPNIKMMEGKLVKVTGFIIPWDETGKSVAISANPDKTCFFCTNANPLSVMDVELKNPKQKFHVDDFTTFMGTLVLNDSDIHQLNYILKDGVPVK